jgi:hypothetical protein
MELSLIDGESIGERPGDFGETARVARFFLIFWRRIVENKRPTGLDWRASRLRIYWAFSRTRAAVVFSKLVCKGVVKITLRVDGACRIFTVAV